MTTAEGQSQLAVASVGLVGDPGQGGRFTVSHRDWPGWVFAVTMNSAGALVGFEMFAEGAESVRDGIPPPEGPELTARLVRTVPFRDLEHAARAWIRRAQGAHASPDAKRRLSMLAGEQPQAGRRSTWGQVEVARLCADYVDLIDAGDPAPVKTLAAQLHRGEKRIRNLLAGARAELLTAAPAGRAGGQLTDYAKEILSGNDQAP